MQSTQRQLVCFIIRFAEDLVQFTVYIYTKPMNSIPSINRQGVYVKYVHQLNYSYIYE